MRSCLWKNCLDYAIISLLVRFGTAGRLIYLWLESEKPIKSQREKGNLEEFWFNGQNTVCVFRKYMNKDRNPLIFQAF